MKKVLNIVLIMTILFSCFIPPYEYQSVKADSYPTYGIVNFKTKSSSANTTYTTEDGKTGYTNGSYGADAAFLGIENGKVKFKLSGVVGYVNPWEVEVRNMDPEIPTTYMSSYIIGDGVIKHVIQLDVTKYASANTITIGRAPEGIPNGQYFSYDGIYFYPSNLNGLKTMLDDYKKGTTARAINANNPYYNYYLYLPARSISNYTSADLKNDFSSYVSKMTTYPAPANQSHLYGEHISFIEYQGEYGVNAMMSLGLAKNESAMGRSQIAYNKNNLFGMAAYDSNTGAAFSFETVRLGIRYFTKNMISEGYLDPKDYGKRYYGGHFGNKGSGFNVKYASDPYWGEKEASYYYNFDRVYGNQDYNKNKIAVKTNGNNVAIKSEATNQSATLYETGTTKNMPFVVLGTVTNKEGTWYRIQTDPVLNESRTGIVQDNGAYDFTHNYGYIHASHIGYVSKGNDVKNRYQITFDANGGKFETGESSVRKISVEEFVVPEVTKPTRSGYTFVGWDTSVSPAQENKTYRAVWKSLNPAKYNITFDAAGGVFKDGSKTKNIVTEEATMPKVPENPTRSGYTFLGWDSEIALATGNKTYKALWRKETQYFDVTFDANGGMFTDGNTSYIQTVEEGKLPTVPTDPTKKGYRFKGWEPKVTEVTKKTTYKAIWEEVKTYTITFDASGGKFANNKETLSMNVEENQLPVPEQPYKTGYVFETWEPQLEKATGNKTYRAIWKEGNIEDTLTKKDGEFYLNELKWNQSKKQYDVSGYLIMLGASNSKQDYIRYEMVLKDKNSEKEYYVPVSRWLENVPFDLGSENGYDYSASWFKGSVDFDQIPQGDYDVYMRAYSDHNYTKTVFSNLFNKSIVRRGETEHKGTSFIVELGKVNKQLVLSVRDEGLITTSESNTFRNMTNDYDDISFEGNLLKVMGTSYNYGGNYGNAKDIKRTLILENIDTFKRYSYNVGSTNKGSYKVSIGDNVSKDYAWYHEKIDVTKLPKGTYAFIVHTKTSNVEDYGEITDKFAAINKAKLTKDGVTYEVTLNKKRNNRIELKIY